MKPRRQTQRAVAVAAILALLIPAGCATDLRPRQALEGEWRVVDLNGVPVAAASAVTLELADERVSGSTGCNRFTGSYERRSRERVRITPLATTRAACAEPALAEQERRYTAMLEAAESYSFYGDGDLSLIAGDGRAIRLRRTR